MSTTGASAGSDALDRSTRQRTAPRTPQIAPAVMADAVASSSDRPVLEECIRGERAALAAYKQALQLASAGVLPIAVRSMLEAQAGALAYDLDDLRRELEHLPSA